MSSFDFRNKCVFQTQSTDQNDLGEQKNTWTDFLTIGGRVRQVQFNEITPLSRQSALQAIQIDVRKSPKTEQLDTNGRVLVLNETYYITNVDKFFSKHITRVVAERRDA